MCECVCVCVAAHSSSARHFCRGSRDLRHRASLEEYSVLLHSDALQPGHTLQQHKGHIISELCLKLNKTQAEINYALLSRTF